ncbi:MAG: hypothetical protein H5T73_09320 [Actinobacteria bacterium]|nr:hypothetical protein [Actinomycetota bacterium]
MEILALLLLGLIAMLAIVPPIIRNKLEESPLTTTESFQRSMQEIAHSIEVRENAQEVRVSRSPAGMYAREERARGRAVSAAAHGRARGHRRAAARRARIITALTFFSFCWGAATLFSGRTWCLAVFAASVSMLVLYWGLVMLVPYLSVMPSLEKEGRELQVPRRKQAV